MSLYTFNKSSGFTNAKIEAVAFEGPDCCGKSTQVDLFINDLKMDYDVILKFHFPLNAYGGDELKNNYKYLCNTIYSNDFMMSKQDTAWFTDLENALSYNVERNSHDKTDFMRTLYYMIQHGKLDVPLLRNQPNSTVKFLLQNSNTEVWFNGNKLNTENSTELQCIEEYFAKTLKPSVLIVFDRFIISGIIYNYFLPEAVINHYINIWKENNNGVYENEEKMKNFLAVLRSEQSNFTNNEIVIFNQIIGSPLLSTVSDASIETYCEPTMNWFVFKPSEMIYKAFLEDKERKSEEYDTNDLIRTSVNEIYNDICTYGNESKYLMEFKFNLNTIDTDKLSEDASEHVSSKECVASPIHCVFFMSHSRATDIENYISSFLNGAFYATEARGK